MFESLRNLLIPNGRIAKIRCFTEIDSTNSLGKRLLADGEPVVGPILLVADRQTDGRGRDDHHWWSPEGAALFSLVARWRDFGLTRSDSAELSLRCAHAVAETLEEKAANAPSAAKVEVRPPNDVFWNGKKIAGILIESPTPEFVIVGIGININNRAADAPEKLRGGLTGLADEFGREIERSELIETILRRLLP